MAQVRLAPLGLGRLQVLHDQHIRRVIHQPLHGEVNERSHPRGLRGAAAVVDEGAGAIGHVLVQERHQPARADMRRCSHPDNSPITCPASTASVSSNSSFTQDICNNDNSVPVA